MPFGLPFGHKAVMPNKPVAITELGKRKAEEMMLEGSKYEILNALNESSPATVNELAEATGVNPHKVRDTIKGFIKNGYVSPVNTGG